MNLKFGNPNNMLKSVEKQLNALDKNIKRNAYFLDSDGDGYINMIDCRPYDKKRQDIKPNRLMRERIKKLRIAFFKKHDVKKDPALQVLGGEGYTYDETYKKDAPKEVKSSRRHFESVAKKRPDVVGAIERGEAPVVVFTDEQAYFEPTEREAKIRGLKAGKKYKTSGMTYPATRSVYVHTGHRHPKVTKRQNIDLVAGTIHHEEEHVKQFSKGDLEYVNRVMFSPDLPYEKQLGERLARGVAREQARKRYGYDKESLRGFWSGFRKMMGD